MNAVHRRGVTALRILIGLVFIYAGVVKAQSLHEFRAQILGFRMVPTEWASFIAKSLPFFEAISGFWLVLGWRHRVPALAVLLMSAGFALVIVQALGRHLDIACGCFGNMDSGPRALWLSFTKDLILVACSWVVYGAACKGETAEDQ